MNKLDLTTHGAALLASRATEKFLLVLEAADLAKSLVRMPDWNSDGTVVAVVDSLSAWRQLTEVDRESRAWREVDVDDVERLPLSHRRFRRHTSIGPSEAVLWGHCKASGVRVELLTSLPIVHAQHDDEEAITTRVAKYCLPQGVSVSLADRGEKWWTVEEYEHDCVLIDTLLPTDEWDEYELDIVRRIEADHESGRRFIGNVMCQAHCRELRPGLLLATFVPFEEQRERGFRL